MLAWFHKFNCEELNDSLDDLCHYQKDKDNTVYMPKANKCSKETTDDDCVMLCHSY